MGVQTAPFHVEHRGSVMVLHLYLLASAASRLWRQPFDQHDNAGHFKNPRAAFSDLRRPATDPPDGVAVALDLFPGTHAFEGK
jgi:hypothetical protein